MRKDLLGLLLIGGLAGCTSQWDSDRSEASLATSVAPRAETGPSAPPPTAPRGSLSSFASLPDRGELLQYASDRKVRKSGAYTFHPVSISEAHALHAIASGDMRINMPDGRALDLAYERHEEQIDGNWTWIGRNDDGSQAVLTFGDKAVFGEISSGGNTYRVRTDRAGAWIVETDRLLLAAGGGNGRRKAGPDYLVPPVTAQAQATAVASATSFKAAASDADAKVAGVPEKATAVVDVLLGYSNGLATRVGSQSGAQTLMVSRVALTNNAYTASNVNMRLRLVHSMQVTYADTSDNQDALEKMSGYDADTQATIPVDPAFTALRAAREEYGADLVALVRNYREPDQDGCGIAWLIGMNQRTITVAADAPFGYAVVGDGTDVDETDGNTYFCSQYALAHELGHLMGQAHNSENAAGRAGAHTYSYGYREATSSGFFTIMAYPLDDTQADNEIGHFANPSVNYSGRPTGTATRDNVRSMNITMPIISNFRDIKVPLPDTPRNDVDGDGRSDLLWSRPSSSQFLQWLMNGATRTSETTYSIASSYDAIGSGDFNGDGRTDIVWRHRTSGAIYLWERLAAGGYTTKFVTTLTPLDWKLVGTGDTNLDGKDDMLWSRPASSQFVRWVMDGATISSQASHAIASSYDALGNGDFNGDGRTDIVWRHRTNGGIYVWEGTASGYTTKYVTTLTPLNWMFVGTGDVNLDGRDDMLWSRPGSSRFVHWIMNGSTISSQAPFDIASAYDAIGSGDFNGDGRVDIIWRHRTGGDVYLWEKRSTSGYVTRFVANQPTSWLLLK